jgi:hypothetical protein
VLFEISRRGIALRCGHTEDRLNAKPTSALTPELIEGIREHKMEIIKIVREDGEMRLSDIVQSERQVFDLARELYRPRRRCPRRPPGRRRLLDKLFRHLDPKGRNDTDAVDIAETRPRSQPR